MSGYRKADVEHEVDYLIIGSGVAGLTFALNVGKFGKTVILTKKNRAESNSNYAQGGIAGVMSDDDSIEQHAEDTLIAGAGLCYPKAVEVLVAEGPERIRDLINLGAIFTMAEGDPTGTVLALGREGGHSKNRIVHSVDRTGWECERTLLNAARDVENLEILEHFFVLDLAIASTESGDVCCGAFALEHLTGNIHLFRAKQTLLATGGCGRVYLHTTNPAIATGDGVAMAYRANAKIANMEFIQFHPTALFHPEGRSFLISEAVRGEGGILKNLGGERFMQKYHPLAELAPRDIVARAIHAERTSRNESNVVLDVTHLGREFLESRFPTIFQRCLSLGIDISQTPIPVVPAAHYACGGVWTDLDGQTSIDGLFAAGEVACTGVHGANRLASNSLLEAMVFGYRSALTALKSAPANTKSNPKLSLPEATDTSATEDVAGIRLQLEETMDRLVGIVRSNADLNTAHDEVAKLDVIISAMAGKEVSADVWEARNMVTTGSLIVQCAQMRHESRGLQYNTDFPETLESERHATVVTRGQK
ncbi:MAG: L-aspartate oxidase [Chthonomonadales bacterium]